MCKPAIVNCFHLHMLCIRNYGADHQTFCALHTSDATTQNVHVISIVVIGVLAVVTGQVTGIGL